MTVGELAFVLVGLPFYLLWVLPNHDDGTLPGLMPWAADGVSPLAAIAAAAGVLTVTFALFLILHRFFGRTHFQSEATDMLARDFSRADLVPLYLAAGIGEEFLFRVALVEPLGVVLSAVLFAAIHASYWKKPLIMAFVLVIGLLLGALYAYTQSLLLCALVHAIYNYGATVHLKRQMAAA
ncbi:MAG: CPBP family intramembrane metalloprotease [Coriobacteriia bacterium]|nr:CPBP family intramembrane metalloprotease [Coriobacteriia bacterium]